MYIHCFFKYRYSTGLVPCFSISLYAGYVNVNQISKDLVDIFVSRSKQYCDRSCRYGTVVPSCRYGTVVPIVQQRNSYEKMRSSQLFYIRVTDPVNFSQDPDPANQNMKNLIRILTSAPGYGTVLQPR